MKGLVEANNRFIESNLDGKVFVGRYKEVRYGVTSDLSDVPIWITFVYLTDSVWSPTVLFAFLCEYEQNPFDSDRLSL